MKLKFRDLFAGKAVPFLKPQNQGMIDKIPLIAKGAEVAFSSFWYRAGELFQNLPRLRPAQPDY